MIFTIVFSVLLPICVSVIFAMVRHANIKTPKNMSDKHFTIMVPKIVSIIGILLVMASAIVVLCFTIFSAELPHIIFYITFGLFICLGMYLVLKTCCFKIIINNDVITVHSIFKKSFSFTFTEIVSVKRQVKNTYQSQSERVIIKTSSGKKVIAESTEIAYKKLIKRIKSEVKDECLFGF